jgi:hypothetical protein
MAIDNHEWAAQAVGGDVIGEVLKLFGRHHAEHLGHAVNWQFEHVDGVMPRFGL